MSKLIFYFFGVDVLAGGTQDERFDAASDEQIAFTVHYTQVSGAEPAVLREGGGIGLGVFVIAVEEVEAPGLNFSGDALRV